MKMWGRYIVMTDLFWPLETKLLYVTMNWLHHCFLHVVKPLWATFHQNLRGSLFDDLTWFDLWRSNYYMWCWTDLPIVLSMLKSTYDQIFIKIWGGHFLMTWPVLTSGGQTIICDIELTSPLYSAWWKAPMTKFSSKSEGVTFWWLWPVLTSAGQAIICDVELISTMYSAYWKASVCKVSSKSECSWMCC